MKSITILLCVCCSAVAMAQNFSAKVERNKTLPLAKVIDFSDPLLQDWEPYVLTVSQPDGSQKEIPHKKEVNEMRRQHKLQSRGTAGARDLSVPSPVMLNNFIGNTTQGTPNDNHMAISNAGKIVSVVNTNFRVYDESGTQLQSKTLSTFANALGILTFISDPRVVYDPVLDRFVVVFFTGNTSTTNNVILAFSKTADPTGAWNFYTLSGNYLNDTTWSDYPIVTLSDKDLFITFNQLKDNSDWQTGFRYSIIWQVDKAKGFAGDSLEFNYWHDILHNGVPIWNICPVQGGSLPSGPETYLVSVRPHDVINDTVFLSKISNSVQSGTAQFSTKVLKTDVPYGLAPNADQRGGQHLATNDARVLSAIIENDKIQYVQNTIGPATFTSGVYVGEIDAPASASPVVHGQIINYDTIDLGYPSIAYIGNNTFDHRTIITCSYSSPDTFPGTVAFYKNSEGKISEMTIIKSGQAELDVLGDTLERWGDYTGIQRKYNEPNTAWLSGSYAYPTSFYRTWIAKVVNEDSSEVSSIPAQPQAPKAVVFPNPSSEKFSVKINLPANNFTQFALYDINGKEVRILLEGNFKTGSAIFSFNTQYLTPGIYFLKITNRGSLISTEKIIISR